MPSGREAPAAPELDKRRLSLLYSLVWAAADAETNDPEMAGRVARRAFLLAQVEGLP